MVRGAGGGMQSSAQDCRAAVAAAGVEEEVVLDVVLPSLEVFLRMDTVRVTRFQLSIRSS